MKRRMKQKKYGILMVVGIVMMVLMPFAPCRADWVYVSPPEGENTTPATDDDSGSDPDWSWSYSITDINRGADITGSWAYADFEAAEYAEVVASGEADPDKPDQLEVWGKCHWADIANPNYTSDGLDLTWELSASGTATVAGYVIDGNLNTGDTLYSSGVAGGAGITWAILGAGLAQGFVEEDSFGWAWAGVTGEATEDEEPDVDDDEYGWYYAQITFTIYADDSQDDVEATAGSNTFTGTSALWVVTDAYTSASITEGYSGKAVASATIEFGGTADLYVYPPE